MTGWSVHVSALDNFKLFGYWLSPKVLLCAVNVLGLPRAILRRYGIGELRVSSSFMTRLETGIPTCVKQTFALAHFVGGTTNHRMNEGPGTGTTDDRVWGC